MKPNILTIYPKGSFSDKNINVQLYKSHPYKHENLKAIVRGIGQYNEHPEFKSLNLFIQGDQPDWIMIESWSDNEDLFLEFVEFLGKELDLRIDIA